MKPYSLGVRAVILDGRGACLLLRRSAANRHFAGAWEWPGGKLEPGEEFAPALVRETQEEIGLDVEITGLAGATAFELPAVHVVVLCMEARITGGAARLSHEHDAWEWTPLSEFAQRHLCEPVRAFMLDYARSR